MGTVFAMAWRNVLRNRRRSLMTILSIVIGLVALLFLWAFNDGSYNNDIDNFRLRYVGSIQVHKEDFFRRPTIETHIDDPASVIAAVEEVGVDAWTTRLNSFALVAGEETSAGMMMAGIDPERAPAVSILDDRLVSGRYLVPGDANAALLGVRAARKLKVGLGKDIVLLSTYRFGAMAADRFEVVGLFATGDPLIDESTAFVTLAAAPTPAPAADVGALGTLSGSVTALAWRTRDEAGDPIAIALARLRLELDGLRVADAGDFSWLLSYDNQVLAGGLVESAGFPALASVPEPTYFDLHREVAAGGEVRWTHRVHRASLGWEADWGRIITGRQRVAWGSGRIWNPTDRFNPSSATSFEPGEKTGTDAVFAERYAGFFGALQAVAAPGKVRGASRARPQCAGATPSGKPTTPSSPGVSVASPSPASTSQPTSPAAACTSRPPPAGPRGKRATSSSWPGTTPCGSRRSSLVHLP